MMAIYNIDPSNQQYTRMLGEFRALRNKLRPYIKLYYSLPEDQRQEWKSRDPLLSEFIEMCTKVAVKNNDD